MKKITTRNIQSACESLWKGVMGMACLLFVWSACNMVTVEANDIMPDVRITLEANDESLADVLEKITEKTGYRFVIDEQWRDHPVKIALQNSPLEKGLERILAHLAHATVYEGDKTIKIMIYEEISDPGATGAAPSRAYRSGGSTRYPDRINRPAPGRIPPPPPREPEQMIRPEDIPNMDPAEAQAAFQQLWEAGKKAHMEAMGE